MPGQDELDRISKEIDDYNKTVKEDYDFGGNLTRLLNRAEWFKANSVSSDEARNWAVMRTELEKIHAYYQTYLASARQVVQGGSE